MLKTLLLSLLIAANLSAQASVQIVAAYFGWNDHFADVTRQVRGLVRNNGLSFPVNLDTLRIDPLPNVPKVLRVYYRYNGQFAQGEWREGDVAQISPNGQRAGFRDDRRTNLGDLRITRAFYGVGDQVLDVTNMMQSRVSGNRLEFQVINQNMGGDPAVNIPKTLLVNYEYQGQAYNLEVPENEWLRLPEGNGGAAPAGRRLRIISAEYGQGNRRMDVTGMLASRVDRDRLSTPVGNDVFGGDPAPNIPKELHVVYEIDGQRMERRVREGDQLNIP